MAKQRLYHSNFNHLGCIKSKGDKSRAHNLRAENALQELYQQSVALEEICDPEKRKNNLLFIPDENGKLQKANPLDGDLHFKKIKKQLADEKTEYLQKLENAYSDSNKAELSGKRAKAKAALKRFANSSADLEKDFWADLTERLGSEQIDTEIEIARLKATGNKISRFNQKVKRISELSDYNGLIGVKSRNTEYTVYSKEVLYKIPDDTDLNIKPMDMANFVNNMNKRLYPDFQPTYITIHADENEDRAHAHCEFSGKNLKTGEMDIQQQLFLNLEKELKKKNKPFPFSDKKYSSLDFDEVKQFGEIYQDFIFEEMNSYLLKKGYNAKLEKRTEEEKKNDSQKFFDKHKSTQNREYTRANKLKQENEAAEEKLETTNELIDKNENEISTQKNEIEQNKKQVENLKEEVNSWQDKLSKVQELFYNGLKNAVDYAMKKLPINLQNYIENQRAIDELKIESGNELHKKAIDVQPDEEQKNNIRRGRGNRI